ncbi:MAG TPA: hypothetical protein VFJ08_05910 [Salinisphaera sp.]|nr:hypothetical protein [Salinisphaera sp.]
MSGMTVGSALSADTDNNARWAAAHPVWARLGATLDRLAGFCGSHNAGYVSPLRLKDR